MAAAAAPSEGGGGLGGAFVEAGVRARPFMIVCGACLLCQRSKNCPFTHPPPHGLFLPVAAAAAATLAAAARAWEVALATRAAAAARSEKLTGEWRCEALALAEAEAPVGEPGVWWRALLLVALCVGE